MNEEQENIEELEGYLKRVVSELKSRTDMYTEALTQLNELNQRYIDIGDKVRFGNGRRLAEVKSNMKLKKNIKNKLNSAQSNITNLKIDVERAKQRYNEVLFELETMKKKVGTELSE